MIHETGVGHIPAAHIASWGCTCGDAETWDYGNTCDGGFAVRLAALRAGRHISAAVRSDLTPTEDT